jgi:hypothetical protein
MFKAQSKTDNCSWMADELDAKTRTKEPLDAEITDTEKDCRWAYANLRYQKQLVGFDTIKDAREQEGGSAHRYLA